MQFMSARFSGDAELERILNDPDTDTAFLQTGSPVDAVRAVQQALADLRWPLEVSPPIPLENFADGAFGSNTSDTVLAYRRCFHVVSPNNGTVDGHPGPRTLWLLDKHITWFDLLLDEVDAKIAEIQAAGSAVEIGDATKAIRQAALKRNVVVDGVPGAVFAANGKVPVLVRTPFLEAYLDRVRSFGAPVQDERDGPDGTREIEFEFGTLRLDPATGSVSRVEEEMLPDLVF